MYFIVMEVASQNFALKGDIAYSKTQTRLETFENSYLVCEKGKSAGVFPRLPEAFAGFPLIDYTGRLILPGLTDLHMHAPQFSFRSLGMDLELLSWLEKHAFPEEAKYRDAEYARLAYGLLTEHLKRSPNTRFCIFATIHVPATVILMDLLEESGLVSMVGKVNMDRNSPDILREADAETSAAATREWLTALADRNYKNTYPILTPRFIPSCSDDLMAALARIQKHCAAAHSPRALPLQSHLSENQREIAWVRELCPEAGCYGDAYARHDLFGAEIPTIMAHCVWSGEEELRLMRSRGVYIAHCPQSNLNISSGIAPVRRFLDMGIPTGLGSDVAGGVHTSIFRAMTDAIGVSKLRQCLVAKDEAPITFEEAFWMGTLGGGSFFGKAGLPGNAGATGSFDPGYEFDALVIDDADLAAPFSLSVEERLRRTVYLSDDRHIVAKYVRGNLI
ncbi:guanine deaminase [Spirochaetia bacterium]|nr:guanine deaminase [Spirochaetia bacterium]